MDYNLSESISNIKKIDYTQGIIQGSELNVVYGVDRNYELGVAISITSLLIHNQSSFFNFHIFIDELDSKYISRLDELAEQYKTKISLYLVDKNHFINLPNSKVWSHAMYFRLLGFDYLRQFCSKALYLDADVICKGNIDGLFSTKFESNIAIVIEDILKIDQRFSESSLSIFPKNITYFNSGVMYVDLDAWHIENITNKAIGLLNDPIICEKIKYPDQDVLNILLNDKVIYVSSNYNTIYSLKSELLDKTHQEYKKTIKDETVLIHYTGITKPWHVWARYSANSYFDLAYLASPWRNETKKKAFTINEFKKRYKHELAQRNYISGLLYGLYYNMLKLKKRINIDD
ncbi:LPS 1,2-glucosyltransferase [Salmonella enterica subsp. enterica serovar Choleraesuis]|nr:LPS 1,2-glucosyltransferase [Salmonella enterica subsp. enterica serovar Choleraesuis]